MTTAKVESIANFELKTTPNITRAIHLITRELWAHYGRDISRVDLINPISDSPAVTSGEGELKASRDVNLDCLQYSLRKRTHLETPSHTAHTLQAIVELTLTSRGPAQPYTYRGFSNDDNGILDLIISSV